MIGKQQQHLDHGLPATGNTSNHGVPVGKFPRNVPTGIGFIVESTTIVLAHPSKV